jgi:hypothetical protein
MANECFVTEHPNCGCGSSLDLKKICARCLEVCWQKSKQIWTEDLNVNTLCSQKIHAKASEAQSLTVDNLCATAANITDLCVTNLRVNNQTQELVQHKRAYLAFDSDFSYTLGATIDFNATLDDPSSMSGTNPARFISPTAGYWEFNVFINAFDLAGSDLITGIPIGRLTAYVNNVARQSLSVPFLSFATDVKAALTCDLLLAVGDVVTAKLDVLVQSPVSGLVSYAGTMMLRGGPFASVAEPSSMSIILKSGLCNPNGGGGTVTCVPCVPATVPCEVVVGPRCEPCPVV